MRNAKNNLVRTLILLLGWAVVLLGIILMPYPGPGTLIVLGSLAILAREFKWAHDLLQWAKEFFHNWGTWFVKQPLIIKAFFGILTFLTGFVILWMTGGLELVNSILHLGLNWTKSPLFS